MEDEAVRLLDDGKLRRSERVLKQMLGSDKNCLPAHFNLARVYRRTEEYDRALFHSRRTLKLNPKESNAHLNLGLIYECMGRDKPATAHYRKELASNPTSKETLFNIGRLYFEKHRWLQASKYLQYCFDLGHKFELEDTVDKLGFCYYKRRDLKPYISLFTEYVRMVPDAAWAFANLGYALLYADDYKGAVLRLSRANQLRPKKRVATALRQARELLRKKNANGAI